MLYAPAAEMYTSSNGATLVEAPVGVVTERILTSRRKFGIS